MATKKLLRPALIGISFLVLGACLHAQCLVRDVDLQGEYTGACLGGMAEGKGRAKGRDEYEGDFVDGNTHGLGRYAWGASTPWAGNVFIGRFASGSHVEGTYTYAAGVKFEGRFRNALLHGIGSISYPSSNAPKDLPPVLERYKQEADGYVTFSALFSNGKVVRGCTGAAECADLGRQAQDTRRQFCVAVVMANMEIDLLGRQVPNMGLRPLYEASQLRGQGISFDAFQTMERAYQLEVVVNGGALQKLRQIALLRRIPDLDGQEFANTIEAQAGRVDGARAALGAWKNLCLAKSE